MNAGATIRAWPTGRRGQRGTTLVELMVAILIGMMMTVAIFSVLATSEGRKRSLTSVNDIQQAGNVAMYLLDKAVRSSGTGYAQAAAYAYGCRVLATKASTQALPLASALPAPFADVDGGEASNFRLAPVMILPGATTPGDAGVSSDALVVMAASAGYGETPAPVADKLTPSTLTLENTVGYKANDLLMLIDPQPSEAGTRRPCMVAQAASTVTGGATRTLALGGDYQHDTIDGVTIESSYTMDTAVANLGPSPQFQLLGVGDHSTLFSYDLLNVQSPALQAKAEGVYLMFALYGLDTDSGTAGIESWKRPDGDFEPSKLATGTAIAGERLQQIKAVRIALVMRTTLAERDDVTNANLSIFSDAGDGNTISVAISGDAKRYRYRVVDTVIPLRNNLLLPQ